MDETQAKALREPFPAAAVGKLPKPKRKDAEKGNCPECGGWHGLPAVHLDYVGHAATTDRLLAVDPEWTWKPMALTPEGAPLIRDGGLWIWLTVCGVTRPGFGDGNSTKEMIGDAIRNAAMRFGVALDLWAKEDLSDIAHQEPVELASPALLNAIAAGLDGLEPQERAAIKAWWPKDFGSVKAGTLTEPQALVVAGRLRIEPGPVSPGPEMED